MTAVYARWPDVTVQFEDFETPKAVPLLHKYRNRFRCFNDDMQGTGAVTVGALLSAARIADTPLSDLRVVCCGGGSAGQGVSASVSAPMEGDVSAVITGPPPAPRPAAQMLNPKPNISTAPQCLWRWYPWPAPG